MNQPSPLFLRLTIAAITFIVLLLTALYFAGAHLLEHTPQQRHITSLTDPGAFPAVDLAAAKKTFVGQLALIALLMSVAAAALSYWASTRLKRSLAELTRGVEILSDHSFGTSLPPPSLSELAPLVQALNRLGRQLKAHVDSALNQRNAYAAVVSSMDEGVVGLDMAGTILNINPAALVMLDKTPNAVKGRPLYEVLRNRQLSRFVERAVGSTDHIRDDIQLHEHGNRVWQVRAAPLLDGAEQRIGTLLMLNDVTRLRQLETLRKDFVANVSHELKTPLTAIKGFVETLGSGQVEDPAQARRFLQIINNHVNRLTAIVNDLLQLSRIEKESEAQQLHRERVDLRQVIHSCGLLFQTKAAEKGIDLAYDTAPPVLAEVDMALIEQALVNLIDNAVKYCPEKARITIDAAALADEVVIRVADNGTGIPKKAQARLFERFYRVDHARSRQLGGTGLGLAIVKHIAQLHGGRVSIDSTVGKGSTFFIQLPSPDSQVHASPTRRISAQAVARSHSAAGSL